MSFLCLPWKPDHTLIHSVSADIHNKKSILGLRGSFSAEFVVGTTSVVWISHM